MRTYLAVVTEGSFTGGAERLGISKALTSKYIGQLEEHLGVRLLNRTTRRLNITEVGQVYYQRCQQLLDDIDELEAVVQEQQDAPRGRLKVSAPINFGERDLTYAVAEYLKSQPNMSVELVLADRFVNLIEEGFDLAVRIGQLADSSLIARRLASMRVVVCTSPEYFKHSYKPIHPKDLSSHNCVIDLNMQNPEQWSFKEKDKPLQVKVNGRFHVNSAMAVREMLLTGQGIGLCPMHVVEADIRSGQLQILFQEYEALEIGIFAVYPHSRHLAAKVRTFVDFLVEHFS